MLSGRALFAALMITAPAVKFLNVNYDAVKAAAFASDEDWRDALERQTNERMVTLNGFAERSKPRGGGPAAFDFASAKDSERAAWLRDVAVHLKKTIRPAAVNHTITKLDTRAVPQARLVRLIARTRSYAADLQGQGGAIKKDMLYVLCRVHRSSALGANGLGMQMLMLDPNGARVVDFKVSGSSCRAAGLG